MGDVRSMTALELFQALEGLLPDASDREYPGYTGCILATRMAVEIGAHYGVVVRPAACQVVLYNAAYQRHLDAGDEIDVHRWFAEDGAHSVGIGFGLDPQPNKWPGHLIALADDCFADYSIR